MEEKRKAERKKTEHFLGVYDRDTEKLLGRLIDLSIKGMMMRSVKKLKIDSTYEFKIDLPEKVAGSNFLLFDADCVRCSKSTTVEDRYEVGFNITNINFKEIETIQYLLNDPLFQDAEEEVRLTVTMKPD